MDAHRLAEERSLALHRAVKERIARDPSIVARALRQVTPFAGVIPPGTLAIWREVRERAPREAR
jgi:hypothetical protein